MKKYHTYSFLKIILLRKGRKKRPFFFIVIVNSKNIVVDKIGFLQYYFYNSFSLEKGTFSYVFFDYLKLNKWLAKGVKVSYRCSLVLKMLNLF